MKKTGEIASYLIHIFFILIIFVLSIFTSFLFAIWQGYPSGFDAIGHLYRVLFVSQFWPNVNWWPNWAAGMPHFLRYASIEYITLGLFNRLSGISAEKLLVGTTIFSIGLGGVGVYLLINKLSRSKLASLLGGFLYILTPGVWELSARGGGYSRTFAIPFFILAIWAVAVVLDDFVKEKKRHWPYFFSSLFLGLSFLVQFIVGAFAFFFIGGWILAFMGIIKFKKLVLISIKVFIPAILIASPLWVPVIVFGDPKKSIAVGSINWADLKPMPWDILFNFESSIKEVNPYFSNKLTPFLYPLAGILTLLGVILRKGKLGLKSFFERSVWIFVLILTLSFIFVRTVIPYFGIFYAGTITHAFMVDLVPIFAAILVGLLVVYVFRNKWLVGAVSIILIVGVTLWAGYFYKLPERNWQELTKSSPIDLSAKRYPLISQVIKDPFNFNFRFGTSTNSDLAAWFNIVYPYVPQTRDYFAQGIVNSDDDVYKTHVIWESSDNYPETEFILDWFAVNKFAVTFYNDEVQGKYEARSEIFQFLGETEVHKLFEYNNSNPILTATSSPSVLIIGKNAYDFIYRSFAQGNLNSQYLIPIVGKERIDDYEIDELKSFDLIILYNYMYKKRELAFDLLAKYVRHGGGLYIESNKFVEGTGLPEPFPIFSVYETSFNGSWDLNLSPGFKEVDLTKFAPPVYQEGPWGGMIGEEVKDWGEILVARQGKPLIVGGQLGNGRVIWSGMNLPYHVLNNHNQEEAIFFRKLLAWTKHKNDLERFRVTGKAKKDLTYDNPGFKSEFVNPEKFKLTLKQSYKGVLYKGFYFPGWQAKVVVSDGRSLSLPIMRAGPRMIYVRIPDETKEVIFYYQVPKVVVLAKLVAYLTIIFLLCLPLLKKLPLSFVQIRTDKIKTRVSGWWEKDEI